MDYFPYLCSNLNILLYDETDQRCRLLRDAEGVGIGKRVEKISYWGLLLGSVPSRRFDAIEEVLMKAGIVVELGVESGGELIALAGGNDMSIDSSEGLAVVSGDRLDIGGTDEGHGHI